MRTFGSRLFLYLLPALVLLADWTVASGSSPILHYFYAENCPHCRTQQPFLESLQARYPELEIRRYDIWMNRDHFDTLVKLTRQAGSTAVSAPTTALGERVWFGFDEAMGEQMEAAVRRCLEQGCPDALAGLEAPGRTGEEPPKPPGGAWGEKGGESRPIQLPLVGRIDPESVSLPMFTVVLGLLDSFNPCAFFILLFLLGMLVHARSRRTMLLVGGTFVFLSGMIYFLFMAAWLNLFLLAGQMQAVTLIAGAIALFIGAINIKDFFFFHRGITLSIPEGAKPRLFQRMRSLLRATRTSSVLLGTAVLALAANSYELLCTAGFPMVYTRVLTLHPLPPWQHYAFLALYNLVYVLPLLTIVGIFTITLGSRKLSEWHGRVLKLVSGIMMLLLGGVLLVRPALLSTLPAALGLLLAALLGSWAIVVLYGRMGPGKTGVE